MNTPRLVSVAQQAVEVVIAWWLMRRGGKKGPAGRARMAAKLQKVLHTERVKKAMACDSKVRQKR
jgi:hypothetical protein